MPLTALFNGQRVIASSVSGTAIYACCECGDPMHYRRAYKRQDGARVIEHFAHNPAPSGQQRACSLSEGETIEHLISKQLLLTDAPDHFYWLRGASGDVEVSIGDRRADVLFTLSGNQRVAFEAQFTKVSRRQIAQRTRDYHDAGCHVVWCFPERRHDDLYKWAKWHFYCVGLLSDNGEDVQFSGNLNPTRYQPSLRKPFDPDLIGYDFYYQGNTDIDPEFDRLVARDENPPKDANSFPVAPWSINPHTSIQRLIRNYWRVEVQMNSLVLRRLEQICRERGYNYDMTVSALRYIDDR